MNKLHKTWNESCQIYHLLGMRKLKSASPPEKGTKKEGREDSANIFFYKFFKLFVFFSCAIMMKSPGPALAERKEIASMYLCDTHADTLYRRFEEGKKSGWSSASCDITGEKLRQGHVTVQTMALFVGGSPDLRDIASAFEGMWLEGERLEKEGLRRVLDYRDGVEGESAFIYSVEGCDLLKDRPELLENWRTRGVRMAALTWNYENCVGTPAKIDADAPLKPFGREAVREMVRLGIAPDASHLNERGFWDLLEMGVAPVASHSCCRALCGHCRNLSDDQLKALFQAGGYVGVNFYPYFLNDQGRADLDTLCDHVVHMLELGGENHVGFGSDFDGIECKPKGLSGPQDFPALLKRLSQRGLDESLIARLAGKNLLAYYDFFDPRKISAEE